MMKTVGDVLNDINAMEGILNRIKPKEDDPSYSEIWYNDVNTLRDIFRNYKNMLCDLEIKENK